MKTKILLSGALGKMGRLVYETAQSSDQYEITAVVDIKNIGEDIGELLDGTPNGIIIQSNIYAAIESGKPDVAIDFTSPETVYRNAKMYLVSKLPSVIGTTGIDDFMCRDLKLVSEAENVPILIAPNFSLGAVLMMKFSEIAAKYFDDAHVLEAHHAAKKDAPSGTAKMTAQKIGAVMNKSNPDKSPVSKGDYIGGIPVSSIRGGGFNAYQQVTFMSAGQKLVIQHDAPDRSCYMSGIFRAVDYITTHQGFIYGLENILDL